VTTEREGWVGYAFHPDVQGQGLATETVGALVRAGFAQLRLRRITARVFGPARSSSRLLARLGFHLDGVDRVAVLAPDGQAWWDDECWSALPGEVR
jgi:RimJ/RimL family protein N-acetyltransferase